MTCRRRCSTNEAGRGSQTYAFWVRSMGDPGADAAALVAASPARRAAEITVPVLLIGGATDQVVPYNQTERMERALKAANRPVTLVRVEGEGHAPGFWARAKYARFLEDVGKFLDAHIGTRP